MGEHLGFRSTTASIGGLYLMLPLLFVVAHRREVANAIEVASNWSLQSCAFGREQQSRRAGAPAADIESQSVIGEDARWDRKDQPPYTPPPVLQGEDDSETAVPRSPPGSSFTGSSVG